jgi:diguanylate cyclase (GGDEF)-like protein
MLPLRPSLQFAFLAWLFIALLGVLAWISALPLSLSLTAMGSAYLLFGGFLGFALLVTPTGRLRVGPFHQATESTEAPEPLSTMFEPDLRPLAQDERDELTHLLPRKLFFQHLARIINPGKALSGLALVSMDIDRFGNINESVGHETGDLILAKVAQRLINQYPKATLGRTGSDDFTLLAEGIHSATALEGLMHELKQLFQHPIALEGHAVQLTLSVGAALYPQHGETWQTLLKNSETALSKAKKKGGNLALIYSGDMNAQSTVMLKLENDLRRALETDELRLFFQPQVSAETGAIVGAEALIRWLHPEKGLLSPGSFLRMAEDTGLIVPICEWTLQKACTWGKRWQDLGLPEIQLGVNLTSAQFAGPGLVEFVLETIEQTGFPANRLELEITESSAMTESPMVVDMLSRLRQEGIKIAVDDFGTGYCSLSYLKTFPVDTLKIDRTFIKDFTDGPDQANLAFAIIFLGHNLHLHVIAEGVETHAQVASLMTCGCKTLQGFLFSRPLPVEEFQRLLESNPTYSLDELNDITS